VGLTTSNLGTGFIVLVVTVIVFAIFPTLVTTPVLISGIVYVSVRCMLQLNQLLLIYAVITT
jgi:hypothetical protein